ncbi:MBOAT family O-acyltransferase [Candidatus Berkiella aquae]|uniref:Probable alginate O-acetylase n=1 Tax=Candidatus Berkiella aquae TaxID=295108 RepID=A0A0Q9YW16_9GAMM|nr:MBOAT family O-acyltransferase [Candidatus Berkiella aquae]MCS5712325.1 MBOAT family protein [Candidatus Berkiella aquae]
MLFNSYSFIFLFLPIAVFGFYRLGNRFNPKVSLIWLIVASAIFYGWFSPGFLLLLLLSIVVNAIIGKKLIAQKNRSLLITGLVFNLGLIALFKYAHFLAENVAWLLGTQAPTFKIMLPLAISFFTFQQIAFIVDCYHGKVKIFHFLQYCLFIVFFPQLIAGPIVQHHQMIPQIERPHFNRIKMQHIALGLSIFIVGLFKKVIFADNCALFANPIFEAAGKGIELTFFESWWGAIAYTLQLYFDFSGYSDMAIGLALLFNIKLPLNFNSPYKALNIIDFWRRWHITLSTFLRDYLYIPLGGNRKGTYQRQLNLMITMLLGGIWHGASWNFVIWGGLHGLFLMINHSWRTFRQKVLRHDLAISSWQARALSQLMTLFCIVIAWVFFRASTFAEAKQMLSAMLGMNGISLIQSLKSSLGTFTPWLMSHGVTFDGLFANELADLRQATAILIPLWIVVLFLPNSQQFLLSHTRLAQDFMLTMTTGQRLAWKSNTIWAIFIGLLGMISILCLAKASDFIYYQF